ncbi:glycosyltransferase family 9 protein [Thermovirga lienii]|uniref:glycosyltransferase family 9 protein n=1 Tax=Thermovirga lienii TaxID=336261 RepID=UPI002FE39663
MKVDSEKVKKVAVVGLSCLGDMLLASAALWNLRNFLPEAYFVVWVGPGGKAAVKDDPLWDEVRIYDKAGKYGGIRGRLRFIRELRDGGFDLIIDLRSTLVPLFSGCRYTPLWGLREFFLPKRIHEAERNLYAVSTLGVPILRRNLHFHVRKEDRERVSQVLKDVLQGRTFVMMNPGSRNPKKRLPVKLCAEVGKKLAEEHRALIGVIGYSEEERRDAQEVLEGLKPHCLDLSGPLALSLVGAYMERASLFVTGDTAAMHLASALGVPTVGVFGPSKPDRYGPWGNQHRVVLAPVPCAPCNDRGCVMGDDFRCLELVESQEVYGACAELLSQL